MRRLLLATTALTTMVACKKEPKYEPVHGNPKGAHYDDAAPPVIPADAGVAAEPPDAATAPVDAPVIHRMPANPKGAHYDAGAPKPQP
jgi:hypothetical protein